MIEERFTVWMIDDVPDFRAFMARQLWAMRKELRKSIRLIPDLNFGATEQKPYYYQHAEGEGLCQCEYPKIWQAWPHECRACGKVLPV
jgi:hypothetical protein